METPEDKHKAYLLRANRGEVRVWSTSPFKLMKPRRNLNEISQQEDEIDRNVRETENSNMQEQDDVNANENVALKMENRRLKNQIFKMIRRNGPKRGNGGGANGAVDAAAGVVVVAHSKKVFKCDTCNREFTFQSALTRHINGVHLKKKPHQCPKCPYSDFQASNLRSHLALKHGVVYKPNGHLNEAQPRN